MEVLIFRTDINSTIGLSLLKTLFNKMWQIKSWSVDLEDDEKVLRVESVHLSADKIAGMVTGLGISCRELEG